MCARLAPILALALALACGHAETATAANAPPIVITGASLIDATGAAPTARDVVVRDGLIADLSEPAAQRAPTGARVIDGRGKFLIPGLWDMHVHVLRGRRPQAYFALLIARGITGVRDMGTDMPLPQILALRDQVESGARLGPHIVAAGPLVDGPYPQLPGISLVVRNAAEARAAVDRLKAQGADFIKVYNRLSPDAFAAIAAESKRLDIPFAGHVPFSVSARTASDSGQASIEHLFNVAFACSTREDELMQAKAEAMAPGLAGERRDKRRAYLHGVLDSFSAARCDLLFARFKRNGTWQVPTIAQRRLFAYPAEIAADDPRLRYVARSLRSTFDPQRDSRVQNQDPQDQEIQRLNYERDRSLIAPMRRAGVRFLAGSDAGDPFSLPGFSLHEELQALVSAGLTPFEALQAATRNAAQFLKRDDFGTIEVGKRADLVLLDADPLADIRNTQRIAGVVLGGRYWSRPDLDRLLDRIAADAERN